MLHPSGGGEMRDLSGLRRHTWTRAIAFLLAHLLALPGEVLAAGPMVLTVPAPAIARAAAATSPSGDTAPAIGSSATPSCPDSLASGAYPVASVALGELWPPNHVVVDVGLSVSVGAACVGRARVEVTVYSDEPDDALGDGTTIRDAQLDAPLLFLRREREGPADGRVYLILATASDSGVAGTSCAAVTVPHSQSKADRASVQKQAAAALTICRGGAVPTGYHLLTQGVLSGGNAAPVVDAGANQAVELGTTVHLDGTVSDDGLPSGALTIAWTQVAGPVPASARLAVYGGHRRYVYGPRLVPLPPDSQ